jgi:hypothetical protein
LRVLRPGGRLVLLSEPTAPAWLRDWSHRKLNRLRKGTGADVDEDCLVLSQLRRWGGSWAPRCRFTSTRSGRGGRSRSRA